MSGLKNKIRELAKEYSPYFTDVRHHLHAHPELSYQEYQTSAYVQQQLASFGITDQKVMGGTGVIAILKGREPQKEPLLFARTWMRCQSRKRITSNTGQ